MLADHFEMPELIALVKQVLPDLIVTALNQNHFPDWVWKNSLGEDEGMSRKQTGEFLSDIDGTLEQFQRESTMVNQHGLLLEGIAEPKAGGTQTYVLSKDGRYFRPAKFFKIQYSYYEASLVALERSGVLVWKTSSYIGSAEALVRLEKSALKPGSNLLERHFKPRPDYHPNPQVMSLMNLVAKSDSGRITGIGVGEKLAEALISNFGSIYGILNTSPETIAEFTPGVGLIKAKQIHAALGRVEK